MVDMFNLNFIGPKYNTVKQKGKKGIRFMPWEDHDIFAW